MFNEDDLNQRQRVKCAFETLPRSSTPSNLPTHYCAELGRMHIHRG